MNSARSDAERRQRLGAIAEDHADPDVRYVAADLGEQMETVLGNPLARRAADPDDVRVRVDDLLSTTVIPEPDPSVEPLDREADRLREMRRLAWSRSNRRARWWRLGRRWRARRSDPAERLGAMTIRDAAREAHVELRGNDGQPFHCGKRMEVYAGITGVDYARCRCGVTLYRLDSPHTNGGVLPALDDRAALGDRIWAVHQP